jgi:predicted nucleotidyltransferase
VLERVQDAVRRHAPDASVVVYGSAARGARTEESDYDVLIVTPSPMDKSTDEAIQRDVYAIELEMAVVVSLVCYSAAQWNSALMSAIPFRRAVEAEGIRL